MIFLFNNTAFHLKPPQFVMPLKTKHCSWHIFWKRKLFSLVIKFDWQQPIAHGDTQHTQFGAQCLVRHRILGFTLWMRCLCIPVFQRFATPCTSPVLAPSLPGCVRPCQVIKIAFQTQDKTHLFDFPQVPEWAECSKTAQAHECMVEPNVQYTDDSAIPAVCVEGPRKGAPVTLNTTRCDNQNKSAQFGQKAFAHWCSTKTRTQGKLDITWTATTGLVGVWVISSWCGVRSLPGCLALQFARRATNMFFAHKCSKKAGNKLKT